jgi:hypothetical protein
MTKELTHSPHQGFLGFKLGGSGNANVVCKGCVVGKVKVQFREGVDLCVLLHPLFYISEGCSVDQSWKAEVEGDNQISQSEGSNSGDIFLRLLDLTDHSLPIESTNELQVMLGFHGFT